MSVDNFDGDGSADQPSVIYAYDRGNEIRELCRSGDFSGNVFKRESTRSNPTERLPELELPGSRGLKEDDCGEEIPVFACGECGKPKYLGRCCASPTCERDWPAAVKRKATTLAGKLEALRRKIYADYDGQKNVDFNHIVASLPDFLVDSKKPVNRALLILKTLLEENWQIEGFAAIYHPYRIKTEYRKDQYEHDGEEGEGDMTWSDVLSSDNPEKYVQYSPHFHLFFPAVRRSFDYLVAQAVANKSGWVFHRITHEDSNISVRDLEDLVRQVTYAFSHAGVNDWRADRSELTSAMKGQLHNIWVAEDIKAKCKSHFCNAAPELLGSAFVNTDEMSCDAEIASSESSNRIQERTKEPDQPIHNTLTDESESLVRNESQGEANESKPTEDGDAATSSEPDKSDTEGLEMGHQQSTSGDKNATTVLETSSQEPGVVDTTGEEDDKSDSTTSPFVDRRSGCGGELILMREAAELLNDSEWCSKAPHVSSLRTAVREWSQLTDGQDHQEWVHEKRGRSPALIQLY